MQIFVAPIPFVPTAGDFIYFELQFYYVAYCAVETHILHSSNVHCKNTLIEGQSKS